MKHLFLVFLFIMCALNDINAQYSSSANPLSVKTLVTDSARYEIIQSPIKRAHTFKLDKFTGCIWQIVETKAGNLKWDYMYVENRLDLLGDDTLSYPRFQIFLSGMVAADAYLLDTKTGNIWKLVRDENEGLWWYLMQ